MMIGTPSVVLQAQLVGVVLVGILLCGALPILVTKNIRNAADRLSTLPGISSEGGIRSGAVMAVYPLAVLALVATVFVVADVPGLVSDSGEADGDGEGDTDPGEETKGNANGDEATNGEDSNGNGEEDVTADARVQVYVLIPTIIEPVPAPRGSVGIYDEDSEEIDREHFDQDHDFEGVNFTALEPDTEYTLETRGVQDLGGERPQETATVVPGEVDEITLEVGYVPEQADSYRFDYYQWEESDDASAGLEHEGFGYVAESGEYFVHFKPNSAHSPAYPPDGELPKFDHEGLSGGANIYIDGEFYQGPWIDGEGFDWREYDVSDVRQLTAYHSDNPRPVTDGFRGYPQISNWTYEGTEVVNDRKTDVYNMTSSSGNDVMVYVDTESHYVIRSEWPHSFGPTYQIFEYREHDEIDELDRDEFDIEIDE